jgi:hypothetical protein
MGPRALEVRHDTVVLGNEINDFHPEVRKGLTERANPTMGSPSEGPTGYLVQCDRVALIDHRVDEAPDEFLIRLNVYDAPPPPDSMPIM